MLHELQHEHEKLAKAYQSMGDQQVQDAKEGSRRASELEREITKLRAVISGMPGTSQHGRHGNHHGDRHNDRHGGRHGGRYKCGDRGQGHWHSGSHWNPFGYSFGNALEDLSKVWDDAVNGWDA